ncbi:histidine kinase dimerization/phosphoacceptor domain -containing protein [Bradyrhizobium diversitatis]|uniref:histidine kinase n=1 Tax=Bradyrhizobium diversitatis TaxID=2755406 RepID=A0ABS0P8L4_9BRAD|nr:histidine kinase dimerization/phosphoacceptor domain -containing protein [Bradyrhizobium diversitatis]MBH5389623.1 response regulator [Bradyrhizobium diversitatis]
MNQPTPTLLYIDDDDALARLVDRGLTRRGYRVVHAASGEEGLERIRRAGAEGGIDVVALDQYMPGLDGLETLEQIMAIPDAPPVVFVTASQDSSIAVTALKAGDHRVGNSLQIIASLLHLQASSAAQDEVKAALTNAMGRVAAVAQVHRRLYTSQDLKSVVLNQYLDSLLEDLRRSAEGNRMSRLTLKAEPIEIDPDRAVAVGIIVNELVMNAVKYAYPDGAGPIHVELVSQGDDLLLSISDDGVGDNVKADPRSTGMGQRIVAAMASKLDASVERDPAHSGTRVVLKFGRAPAAPVKAGTAAAS